MRLCACKASHAECPKAMLHNNKLQISSQHSVATGLYLSVGVRTCISWSSKKSRRVAQKLPALPHFSFEHSLIDVSHERSRDFEETAQEMTKVAEGIDPDIPGVRSFLHSQPEEGGDFFPARGKPRKKNKPSNLVGREKKKQKTFGCRNTFLRNALLYRVCSKGSVA